MFISRMSRGGIPQRTLTRLANSGLRCPTCHKWYVDCLDCALADVQLRKLFDSFYDGNDKVADLKFLIGKVQYWKEAEIAHFMSGVSFYRDVASGGQATGFAKLLCMKREGFEHEREVRLLFQDLDPKRSTGKLTLFDCDVNAICDDVVIDPRLDKAQVATFREEILTAGCTLPVSQSPLYRMPNYIISL
jgi:hypothetical protein